ncbi:PhzF family phenazine biosynthesis protein [soil metagenome]
MPQTIVQVDAFTDQAFSGNPAAVCVMSEPPAEWWMQEVAREMNLSETAFLIAHEDGFDLRWFTPTVEVDLCGHATLASAHVLWQDEHLAASETIRFHTRSGVLEARRDGDWIEMDFPADLPQAIQPPAGVAEALGTRPLSVHRGRDDLLVEVDSEKTLRTLRPDIAQLKSFDARGIIVTAPALPGRFDFVSRFFAPRVGVDEDPVTGSAHCVLAPFWSDRLERPSLTGYQVSSRGGVVRTRVAGERVFLSGQAVTVLRGELLTD